MTEHADAIPDTDPFALFDAWYAEARASEPNDPNAMALATATPQGGPSVRMVLLKDHDADGFVFYTNAQSRKGQEIRANMQAALLFHWKSQQRQIRIEGPLSEVSPAIADDYFHSRAYMSQVGSAASDQSRPLAKRDIYEARIEEIAKEHRDAGEVPRPAHWTGFRLTPVVMEFWQDRANRQHERRQFIKDDARWNSTLLYP